jgi:hypothetical protein
MCSPCADVQVSAHVQNLHSVCSGVHGENVNCVVACANRSFLLHMGKKLLIRTGYSVMCVLARDTIWVGYGNG